jgi:hypothetical protein
MRANHIMIAAEFNTTKSTVFNIVKRFKSEETVQMKLRKGRPHKLSKAQRICIIILLKRDRDITWKALVSYTTVPIQHGKKRPLKCPAPPKTRLGTAQVISEKSTDITAGRLLAVTATPSRCAKGKGSGTDRVTSDQYRRHNCL